MVFYLEVVRNAKLKTEIVSIKLKYIYDQTFTRNESVTLLNIISITKIYLFQN